MFPGGMNMGRLMKQAQDIQRKMEKVQEDLKARVVDATAGGAVTARVNGQQELLDLQIRPEVLKEDPEMLRDLVVTAVNEALKKSKALKEQELGKVSGGLGGLAGM